MDIAFIGGMLRFDEVLGNLCKGLCIPQESVQ